MWDPAQQAQFPLVAFFQAQHRLIEENYEVVVQYGRSEAEDQQY